MKIAIVAGPDGRASRTGEPLGDAQYGRQLAAARVNSIPMQLIADQKGMFSTLPLNDAQVTALREQHGIYMTDSARINVAGLREADIPRFVEALQAVA